MTLREQIHADYEAAVRHRCRFRLASVLFGMLRYDGFRCAVLYRLGHMARKRRMTILSALLGRLSKWGSGADVSVLAQIGAGLSLAHPVGIVIGQEVRIGKNAHILQGATLGGRGKTGSDGRSHPTVGDDVIIGTGAKVLGPITVGHRVRIGANAIVTRDVPDDATVVAIPGYVIRVAGRKIELADRTGELPVLLRDIQRRLDELESRR